MLRARRGARENDYPVPLLRTPLTSTTKALSLLSPHSGGSQLPSPSTSCHVADRERISSCSARRVPRLKSCRTFGRSAWLTLHAVNRRYLYSPYILLSFLYAQCGRAPPSAGRAGAGPARARAASACKQTAAAHTLIRSQYKS